MAVKGFNSDFIGELKNQCDIVTVISKYIPLEKKGKNYWGRCPFHHEKTPSFSVNSANQFYHCFGCNASGDVIKFVQEHESLDFIGAVKILCDTCGLTMPQISLDSEKISEEKKLKERLYLLNKDCAKFYYSALFLEQNKVALQYFNSRGLDKEIITKFGLGYSPDFESSILYLKNLGYKCEEMEKAGIAAQKGGRFYDVLGGRLIFPILNSFSDVVGFGGRIFQNHGFAKYRNTQETQLFNKSKNLYNINLVKKQKQQSKIDAIIVVEGYMDAIALYNAGFVNVVASMGTALTTDQARLLKRFCDNVYICFDGDAAGQAATIRGLEILKELGLNVKVISLKGQKDPDEFIKENGASAFTECINSALPFVDFKLEVILKQNDINTAEGKRKFTKESLRLVKSSEQAVEKEDLLKKIRDITGYTYESLKRDLENIGQEKEFTQKTDFEPLSENKNLRFILYCMLNKIGTEEEYKKIEPYIQKDALKNIYGYLSDCVLKNVKPLSSMLFEYVTESDFNEVIAVLSAADSFESDEEIKNYYKGCIKNFLKLNLDEGIKNLTLLIDSEKDSQMRKNLIEELQKLTIEYKNI